MIKDTSGKCLAVVAPSPFLEPWVLALQESAEAWELDGSLAGLDVRCLFADKGHPSRARLKLFAPEPHVAVAFFYKPSQLPFSTDRFAYGALIHRRTLPRAEEVHAGLEYLRRGLHPEARPAELRRAFPFDIPR